MPHAVKVGENTEITFKEVAMNQSTVTSALRARSWAFACALLSALTPLPPVRRPIGAWASMI